jgi:hypothetical protein
VYSGNIPDFSKNSALFSLQLTFNKLTGAPSTITSDRSELVYSGNIPDFSKNSALSSLQLSMNKLTGAPSMMSSDCTT